MPETAFQRFWRRLQQIGLNAYEARSYMVLSGHRWRRGRLCLGRG